MKFIGSIGSIGFIGPIGLIGFIRFKSYPGLEGWKDLCLYRKSQALHSKPLTGIGFCAL